MTETAAPTTPQSDPPSGPSPLALTVALELVTRRRMRLTDARDSRLGPLLGRYQLAAATWTGPRAALVAFYVPPPDPADAAADLEQRATEAAAWGLQRLHDQGAQRCDIALLALGRVGEVSGVVTPPGASVSVAAAWVDESSGETGTPLRGPRDLPGATELRDHWRTLQRGAVAPTLAQVDLAERQTVAGGYAAPVRRQLEVTRPVVTYALIVSFVAIWLLQHTSTPLGAAISHAGIMVNFGPGSPLAQATGQSTLEWWRLITSAFLHDPSGPWHVLVNCYSMYVLGRLVEQLYGRLALLGVFLSTAALGGAFWAACAAVGIASPGFGLGASGGLCGLLGLVFVLGRVQGRNVAPGLGASLRQAAVQSMVLTIGMGLLIPNVNNWVHAGGFLAGAVVGLVVPPLEAVGGRRMALAERAALGLVIGVAAVAVLVAVSRVPGLYTQFQALQQGI